MIVFLAGLCIAAPLLILFVDPTHDFNPVTQSMRDLVVLPRLAATAAFTGGALLWGAVLLARERWPAGRWPVALWAPVAAFVVVNILALIFAADWRSSLLGVAGGSPRYQGLATILLYVLLFGVAAVAVRTTRDLRWLLLALFIGALGTAIYALVQRAGLDWIPWTGKSVDRPFGTMGQANVLGAFLVASISASLFLVLTARSMWQRLALGTGLLAMVAALFFSVSQSALLAGGVLWLLFGGAVQLWSIPTLRGHLAEFADRLGLPGLAIPTPGLRAALAAVSIGPLLIAVLFVFLIGVPGREAVVDVVDSEAIKGRLNLWRLGLEMAADRPLLGYGQDAFSLKFAEYRDQPDLTGIGVESIQVESSHNFFIDLLSGTGVLGFIAFLGLVGSVFWHAGRRLFATEDPDLRVALVALAGSAMAYLVAVFFGFMEAMSSWVFWLLLGALAGLLAVEPATEEDPADDELEAAAGGKSRRQLRRERREQRRREREATATQPSFLASGAAAVVLSLLGALSLGWGATLVAADLASGQAQLAAGRGGQGEREAEVKLAGRAASLNPLDRDYLLQKAQAQQRASFGAQNQGDGLEDSVATYEQLLSRFDRNAFEILALAEVEATLADLRDMPVEDAFPRLEEAIQLDLFSRDVHLQAADLYERYGNDFRALELRAEAVCWGIGCP